MRKPFDKPIMIQKIDEATENWVDLFEKPIHARINKAKSNNEYLSGGAIQAKISLVFEVRYFATLEDIEFNTQNYRIIYKGEPFDITDYDDFQMKHETIKLLGVSY